MAAETKSTKPQNLILENRKRLTVSGVEEVTGFDDTYVQLHTSLGELLVCGEELRVEELSVETGELTVCGTVASLEYRGEPQRRRGLGRP